MKEQILRDVKNSLLKRREIEILIESEKNPGFKNAKDFVSEKFKVPRENIVMNHIKGEFGKHEFWIDVFIYDSKKDLENVEGKHEEVKEEAKVEASETKEEKPIEVGV